MWQYLCWNGVACLSLSLSLSLSMHSWLYERCEHVFVE